MGELITTGNNDFEMIFSQTIADMKTLGTYRVEFSPVITRYAEMRMQLSVLMVKWYEGKCKITERYTNKAGATNNRKTALYQAIETLRREILELENMLGLTPAGLKKIKQKGLEDKKNSVLAEALKKFGQETV